VYADEVMISLNDHTGRYALWPLRSRRIGSHTDQYQGNYVLVFDPLDGSSNIDINVSIGTIFAYTTRWMRPCAVAWKTACSLPATWSPQVTSVWHKHHAGLQRRAGRARLYLDPNWASFC